MRRMWSAALILGACGLAAVSTAVPTFAGSIDMLGTGGATYNVPVTSMKEARFLRTIHQRFDFSCGSAASPRQLNRN